MKRRNIERCRSLRKNQTDAEKKLWRILRNRRLAGIKFRRQFPVGRYIVDFYSPEYRLGIEADGGQHYEDSGRRQDALRTEELAKSGVQIVRFSDREILNNIEGVCAMLCKTLGEMIPSPSSSPHGGEEMNEVTEI